MPNPLPYYPPRDFIMNSSSSQAAVTGANVMSGEKTFHHLQFAITGDLEIDLIAGIKAVISDFQVNSWAAARALEYMSKRYNDALNMELKQSRDFLPMQSMGTGQIHQSQVEPSYPSTLKGFLTNEQKNKFPGGPP